MALGAVNRDVLFLFLGSSLKMAAYGVAIGGLGVIASAWLLVRVLRIDELGWQPFVTSTLVVTGIALIASFIPAWRATLVTPMVAIRDEPSVNAHIDRLRAKLAQVMVHVQIGPAEPVAL